MAKRYWLRRKKAMELPISAIVGGWRVTSGAEECCNGIKHDEHLCLLVIDPKTRISYQLCAPMGPAKEWNEVDFIAYDQKHSKGSFLNG